MIADYLRLNIPVKDNEFDVIYPAQLRKFSKRHFTPVEVAIKAAKYLAFKPNQKILDIGSGVGKFCFIAGSYTDCSYTGVDYRKDFIDLCLKLKTKHHFKNVNFKHSDILNVNLKNFDGFYFFNSFEEHSDKSAKIDDNIETSFEKFNIYTSYLKSELEKLPSGTRIVTYYGYSEQIPNCYQLINTDFNGLLKCWKKTSNEMCKLI